MIDQHAAIYEMQLQANKFWNFVAIFCFYFLIFIWTLQYTTDEKVVHQL